MTRAIRNGNPQYFQVFYDHFFDDVYQQIAQMTGRDEATCLDIVQETMLKVIRCLKPIDNLPQLTAWVRAVTRTTAYDWLRRDLRHHKQHPAATIEMAVETDQSLIEDQARLLWLQEQLRSLPDGTRNMIALRYRMGWTLKRIGATLGLKSGTVDGRIRRALEKIKQQAEREFGNENAL